MPYPAYKYIKIRKKKQKKRAFKNRPALTREHKQKISETMKRHLKKYGHYHIVHWMIITPFGEILRTDNLWKFCIEWDLHYWCMAMISYNKAKSHKGYKCYRDHLYYNKK